MLRERFDNQLSLHNVTQICKSFEAARLTKEAMAQDDDVPRLAAFRKRSSYKAIVFLDKRSDKTDTKAQCKSCGQSPQARHRYPASNRYLNGGKCGHFANEHKAQCLELSEVASSNINVKVLVPSTLRLIAWDNCFFKRQEHPQHRLLISVCQGREVQQPQP